MAKRKPPNAGKGRPKGSLNKATQEFRLTVQRLLDANIDNVELWLTRVAATDPSRALDLIAKLAEYAAPKLSRTEMTGNVDGTLSVVIKRFSPDANPTAA